MTQSNAGLMGPLECAVIEFDGNHFKGEIIPALQDLIDSKTVRIIDLVVLKKDAEGNGTAIELNELSPDELDDFDQLDGEVDELVSQGDIEIALASMHNNSTAAMLLWEDTWAARLAKSIQDADGQLIMHERIPAEAVEAAFAEND